MIRKLNEDVKDNALKAKQTTLTELKNYITKLEEECNWAEIELEDATNPETADVFREGYLDELIRLLRELTDDVGIAYTSWQKGINEIY